MLNSNTQMYVDLLDKYNYKPIHSDDNTILLMYEKHTMKLYPKLNTFFYQGKTYKGIDKLEQMLNPGKIQLPKNEKLYSKIIYIQKGKKIVPKKVSRLMALYYEVLVTNGFVCEVLKSEIRIQFKGSTIKIFPNKQWHTGKTIKDCRGIDNLLSQLGI